MLHKLFDGHPQLNVYPVDISLLYAYLPCQELNLSNDQAKKRINLVVKKSTAPIEGRKVSGACSGFSADEFCSHFWEQVDANNIREPSAIITAIASAWCRYTNADPEKPFLFKETSQSIHAHRLLRRHLRIKLIQIARDPRDNFAAIKSGVADYYFQMGENEKESLASLINRSRMDLRAAYELHQNALEWFHVLRFEDLVDQTEKTAEALASFCGIDFDPILLAPTLLGTPFSGNSHEGKEFAGVSSTNVGRWRERISHFEAAVIEFWMQDVMDEWGYKRAINSVDAMNAFSEFYNWYNCRYFYYDSFAKKN